MISSEVQRTLVKSPPELWAEISDPEALARHLGEFGEIRITRVDPERRVEWEAGETSGTVVIKPSGWGTKVKLTVRRVLTESETDPAEADADVEEADPSPTSSASPIDRPSTHAGFALGTTPPPTEDTDPAPTHSGPEIEPMALADEDASDAVLESALAPEAEVEQEPQLEPRRSFFARLFGRRRRAPMATAASELPSLEQTELAAEREPELAAEGEPGLAPEPTPEPTPAPAAEPYDALAAWAPELREQHEADTNVEHAAAEAEPPAQAYVATDARAAALEDSPEADADAEQDPDAADGDLSQNLAAELATAEELAAEQAQAVLTGVLDRLGAAHHRPFSRA